MSGKGGMSRERVPSAFDTQARNYDKLVGRNPGYHEHLLASATALDLPDRGAGLRVLDVGCGTGLSTAALLEVAPEADITGVDASAQMLAKAREKPWPGTVRFRHGRAEDIADEGPFDAVFAAYLVRNLADPDAVLTSLKGLLAPGGVLAVHEYVRGANRAARALWNGICWAVIIPMGGFSPLYRHLWRSVKEFDDATEFADRLRRNGFSDVEVRDMDGWQRGIEYTFLARP
ncbi:class I SAM-dependent methyltransferase [Actinokineospora bangkokensis]|uniref:Ubiquinone biosynthesis methyltransferase UbiE n=1 Tax=Actinokineospora bangkokensis TaxID=1193682 RepID=A0A1Q9LNS8_9PSEU|nr:methyltransferase domain-containing protein [Actinokineospora bangkokensis]OLR93692.1 ubiquinone biosynthesis methyltransferase UbiE [Actinokineospora bangkokensis]